jgi:transcriptional regulator with PAS, ATPase and Fis domain
LPEEVAVEPEPTEASAFGALLGRDLKMRRLFNLLADVANTDATVLIEGETGTGKELVAEELHNHSNRSNGPFVVFDCGAVPRELIESSLFGHLKGSFTGAVADRKGAFAEAHGGTIFLDEIGELPLELQPSLLRVLDKKAVRRVGANIYDKVDVRIVAATNRDLKREMQDSRFRKDLYFRLGTTIYVPPLREHLEDVPALVEHFLGGLEVAYHRRVKVSEPAMQRLQTYTWPGNVRQLRMVLENAMARTESNVLSARSLNLLALDETPSVAPDQLPTLNLQELEARAIRQALAQTNGNNAQAARELGIHRDTLYRKMREYGIDRKT